MRSSKWNRTWKSLKAVIKLNRPILKKKEIYFNLNLNKNYNKIRVDVTYSPLFTTYRIFYTNFNLHSIFIWRQTFKTLASTRIISNSIFSLSCFQRWQRRWFVLFDDGELTYAVDEHVSDSIKHDNIHETQVITLNLIAWNHTSSQYEYDRRNWSCWCWTNNRTYAFNTRSNNRSFDICEGNMSRRIEMVVQFSDHIS